MMAKSGRFTGLWRASRAIAAVALCLGLQSGRCQARYRVDHDDDEEHALASMRWTRAARTWVVDPVRGARVRFEAIEGLPALRTSTEDPWRYTELVLLANPELALGDSHGVPLALRRAPQEEGTVALELEWIRPQYPPASWIFRFDEGGRLLAAERSPSRSGF